MNVPTLALLSLLLPATLAAFALPAESVDIECRRSPQVFCTDGDRFCLLI